MVTSTTFDYTAMLLGATGNVGGHILHLLVQSPLCERVIVITRRDVAELANAKVQQVVVNMDRLEEELAPHARDVDIALAAFGVGKGSAKMADAEVRKIEITYPTAFASAARAGGARVLAMMTAVGANSQSSTRYPPHHRRQGVEVEGARVRFPRPLSPRRDPRQLQHALRPRLGHAADPLGAAVALPFDSQERPGARHGRAVGGGIPRARTDTGPTAPW